MADNQPDWGQVESSLKQKAGQWYDPSMLGDVQRNASYGAGTGQGDIQDWIGRIANKAQLRGGNDANSSYVANAQGGETVGPTGRVNAPANPNPTVAGGGLQPFSNQYGASPTTPNPASGWSFASGNTFGSGQFGGQIGSFLNNLNSRNQVVQGRQDQLYGTLMNRAQQGLNINPQDPVIAAQTNAFRAEQDRNARQAVDVAAARGGPNANLNLERRMASEGASRATGGLQAQLMGNELANRRNEIQNALTQMGGMLTQDQQLALQGELGMIDANLRAWQTQIGSDQYGLNRSDLLNERDWRQDRINRGLPVA
jgi:hypothetical protein